MLHLLHQFNDYVKESVKQSYAVNIIFSLGYVDVLLGTFQFHPSQYVLEAKKD